MNVKEYLIPADETDVYITVAVSTAGVASSVLELTLTSGINLEIASSSDLPQMNGSGNIKKTLLGKAAALAGALIEVDTSITLKHIPKTEWPSCFDNLDIKYFLEGGSASQPLFYPLEAVDKIKTESGRTIVAEKYILLKNQ
ncbi:hypothetical protein HNQ91_001719 [Filimonas zeae]|uniref:Uncharacterized protein n=1 Tax=Filimonas zeae TaxID=1737353 RepID=A0A917IX02_9BACT|nr:hypothetical protein [Filimonas zeae]MDR6338668.1 hypothetical protein [Filimonas zeae]GGH67146.1 hypothetical protein GCM10011379_22090 [Filimonas zeae]